jgi:hypothetical protein
VALKGKKYVFSTFSKNIQNQVAWFLADLCKAKKVCKKTSENSAKQSSLGRYSASGNKLSKKKSKTLGPPLFLLLQQILPKKHKGAIVVPHLLLKKNIRPAPLPPLAIIFAKKLQGGPSLS